MSAFVVGPCTIDRIISQLMKQSNQWERMKIAEVTGIKLEEEEGRNKFGFLLLQMNTEAVNFKYGGSDFVAGYSFTSLRVTDIQAYKSLRCLMYQCNEGQVSRKPLFMLLECFAGTFAHAIVKALPEYDEADWG